ncbi:MAG: hypothetical protein M3443_01555, partial [Actinomycetota bacterium]|nr:hypothetical protein [Actinomycetota bacterium]
MRLYAERPVRRLRQLAADLGAVLVLVIAVLAATEARDAVLEFRAPGAGLVDAGNRLSGTFNSAADNADDVPVVGDSLAAALHTGAEGGARLIEAGRWQIEAVEGVAFWLAAAMIAVPVLLLLLLWLPFRLRFARQAGAAARLRAHGVE